MFIDKGINKWFTIIIICSLFKMFVTNPQGAIVKFQCINLNNLPITNSQSKIFKNNISFSIIYQFLSDNPGRENFSKSIMKYEKILSATLWPRRISPFPEYKILRFIASHALIVGFLSINVICCKRRSKIIVSRKYTFPWTGFIFSTR